MIFDLKKHNEYFEVNRLTHEGPSCLCKRFQDGEEMYKPENVPPAPENSAESVVARDPSQSEQSWEEQEPDDVSPDEFSKDEIPK